MALNRKSRRVSRKSDRKSIRVSRKSGRKSIRVSRKSGRKSRRVSRKSGRKSRRVSRKSGRKSRRVSRKSGRKSRRVSRKSGRKSRRVSRKSGRKSRRVSRKSGRKSGRKSRKSRRVSRKSGRKSRRVSRKSGRKSRKSRKSGRKSRKSRRVSRKSGRKNIKLGYRIYNPENPERIKLIKSFNKPENIYGKKSFLKQYPFISEECNRNNVSLMTFEEFVVFKSKNLDRQEIKRFAESISNDRDEIEMIGDVNIPIGMSERKLEEHKKLMNKAIRDGTTARERTFIKKFIGEFFSSNKDYLLELLDKNNYKELKRQTTSVKSECYGSALDCLENNIFKEYIKSTTINHLNNLCKRGTKSLIGLSYITEIIEENIYSVETNSDSSILVILLNNDDQKIISFVSAKANPDKTNDITGKLICTSEGTSGLGKLQMASTLLLARDSNVSFVFIQAIQGYFGVQAGLYAKLGFETDFENYPQILQREYAIEELTQQKRRYLEMGRVGRSLAKMRNPSLVATKAGQGIGLLPMWIYAPSINTECMKNIITKVGWDCRIGEYGGEGGVAKYLSGIPFTGSGRIQRLASQMSKISGRDYSHARESYLSSIGDKSFQSRSPQRAASAAVAGPRGRSRSSRSLSPQRADSVALSGPRMVRDRSRERDTQRSFKIDDIKGSKYE